MTSNANSSRKILAAVMIAILTETELIMRFSDIINHFSAESQNRNRRDYH
jgi:hypothetical protein